MANVDVFNSQDQGSLLTIVAFHREGEHVMLRVPLQYYSSAYRHIAKAMYDYWEEFKKPPGGNMVGIIGQLQDEHPDDEESYDMLYDQMQQHRDNVNIEFYMQKAIRFVRKQAFKMGFQQAVPFINSGDVDEAMRLMEEAYNLKHNLCLDRGLDINLMKHFSGPRLLEQSEIFESGIEILDRNRICPARKEMLMYVAATKTGKSWYMSFLGYRNAMMRHRVCHVTLEMSAEKMSYRYLRGLTNMPDTPTYKRTILNKDGDGKFISVDIEEVTSRIRFDTKEGDKEINKHLTLLGAREKIKIKEFPSGRLSPGMLRKWLNELEAVDGYTPDLLLVDYPDLMRDDSEAKSRDYRLQLDNILVNLRGIAQERNCAVVVASQTNREGSSKKNVRSHDVAESFGKIMTFDKGIFYSQTESEHATGLARLYVMGRDVRANFEFLIAQCYDTAQFCTDCAYIDKECYPPRS